MNLSEDDYEKLNELYKEILTNLKQDFMTMKSLDIRNAIGFIRCFYERVLSHDKSDRHQPVIYNLPSDGILSISGYQVCRTTNILLFDFLNEIGFDSTIQYIFIDENNDWHRRKADSANHVVVCLDDQVRTLFLDLYNGLFFDGSLDSLAIDDDVDIDKNKYKELIERIKCIIDKYGSLQSLGVNFVYTYY